MKPILTPADALNHLYEGNTRFVAGLTDEPRRDIDTVKKLALGQKPFAAFLGCADSRVPIEIIFDQGFGDLFVTRVAGNIASAEVIGSLEFAVEVLGVKIVYVLGHTACGAVEATLARQDVPGMIGSIFHYIRPALRQANHNMDQAVYANTRLQAETLADISPVLHKKLKDGSVSVAAGVYDIATGIVTPVPITLEFWS